MYGKQAYPQEDFMAGQPKESSFRRMNNDTKQFQQGVMYATIKNMQLELEQKKTQFAEQYNQSMTELSQTAQLADGKLQTAQREQMVADKKLQELQAAISQFQQGTSLSNGNPVVDHGYSQLYGGQQQQEQQPSEEELYAMQMLQEQGGAPPEYGMQGAMPPEEQMMPQGIPQGMY
jgi:hypothetical protein